MSLRERMGPPGKGRQMGQTPGFWMGLKRLGWINFMPGCRGRDGRGGGGGRHHRQRHKAVGLAGWHRAARGLPCWGLGAVAGWPWG
jgi:hypothetical protein